MPILPGVHGVEKMSKSLGNHIGVTDPPEEMYGRTLSLPDEAMGQWYALLLGSEPPAGVSARDAKRALARALVARFHDEPAATAAEAHFDRVFVRHEAPEDMPEVAAGGPEIHLPALLADAFGVSRSDARRQLAQGGVRLDGEVVEDVDVPAERVDGRALQLGKRRFARVRVT
jgi:tyrosyl-tRNA synthetase